MTHAARTHDYYERLSADARGEMEKDAAEIKRDFEEFRLFALAEAVTGKQIKAAFKAIEWMRRKMMEIGV